MRRLALGIVLPALALLACAPTDTVDVTSDDLVQAAPIAPVDLLACWVVADTSTTDPFFMRHELRCAPRVPADYPLTVQRFIVEAETANQKHLSEVLEGPDEVLIGTLDSVAFPVRLRTRLSIDGFGLMRETTIDTLEQRTAANPELYRAPFSLWPIEITFVDGARPFVGPHKYAVSVAPYVVGYNFTSEPASDQLSLSPKSSTTNPVTLLLIEPPSKSITVDFVGRNDIVPMQLTGPGNYEFNGETLRKLDGEAPTPTPTPNHPVDETPGCGGADEAPCGNGTCDMGMRLDSNRCRPCGGANQTWCGTANSPTCDDGHRVDNRNGVISTALCVPCGGANQTWCGTANNPICDDGHRVDNRNGVISTALCVPCGGEGQTYCGNSNNRICNEGLSLVNRNGVFTCER